MSLTPSLGLCLSLSVSVSLSPPPSLSLSLLQQYAVFIIMTIMYGISMTFSRILLILYEAEFSVLQHFPFLDLWVSAARPHLFMFSLHPSFSSLLSLEWETLSLYPWTRERQCMADNENSTQLSQTVSRMTHHYIMYLIIGMKTLCVSYACPVLRWMSHHRNKECVMLKSVSC